MMNIEIFKDTYPKTEKLKDGTELSLRLVEENDREMLLSFFSELPEEDTAYIRIDFSSNESIDDYFRNRIKKGKSMTLLGLSGDKIAGIISLHQATAAGAQHVAYVRLSVAKVFRRKGIAAILCDEIYNAALKLQIEKLCAEIIEDQEVAQNIFSGKLGFRKEAILKNHVKDGSGRKHNLIIYSNNPAELVEEIRRRAVFSDMLMSHEY